jgi:hypothetical protein
MKQPKFEVRAYGLHSMDVVGKAMQLATKIDTAKDMAALKLSIAASGVYPKFVGIEMTAWATGKSAAEAMGDHFVRQEAKKARKEG